jgi:hypothetical protein
VEQLSREQVSGSSPLVGSLFFLQKPQKDKSPNGMIEDLAAVGQQ